MHTHTNGPDFDSHVILLGRYLGVLAPDLLDLDGEIGSAVMTGETIWMFDEELDPLLNMAVEPVPIAEFRHHALSILGSLETVESLLVETSLFLSFEWDFLGNDSLSVFDSITFLPTVETVVIDDKTGVVTVTPYEYKVTDLDPVPPKFYMLDEVGYDDMNLFRYKGIDIPLDLAGLFDSPTGINVKQFVQEYSENTSWEPTDIMQIFLDNIGDITRKGCGFVLHENML